MLDRLLLQFGEAVRRPLSFQAARHRSRASLPVPPIRAGQAKPSPKATVDATLAVLANTLFVRDGPSYLVARLVPASGQKKTTLVRGSKLRPSWGLVPWGTALCGNTPQAPEPFGYWSVPITGWGLIGSAIEKQRIWASFQARGRCSF